MFNSLCSPSHILIAANDNSFATRGSLYLDAISRIIPNTKSAVKIDVLFPYRLWNESLSRLFICSSIISSCIIDSVCKSSTATEAKSVLVEGTPTASADNIKIKGLILFPPCVAYNKGS